MIQRYTLVTAIPPYWKKKRQNLPSFPPVPMILICSGTVFGVHPNHFLDGRPSVSKKKERRLMVPMQINHGPTNRSKLSPRKVAAYAGLAVGAVILICALVFLFFPDTYINGYLKNKIVKAFIRAYPAYSIRISGVHYNKWGNRIGCDF